MNIDFLTVIFALLAVFAAVLAVRSELRARRIEKDAAPYLEEKARLAELRDERDALEAAARNQRAEWDRRKAEATTELETLERQLASMRALDDLNAFGLYRPHYDFDLAEKYKERLERVRDRQEQMVRDREAARCRTQWTVEGSAAKGRQMTDRYLKLQLRAFNGECDAAVAKVKYNNALALEERTRKSFEAINKLGATQQCEISREYLELKIEELRLTHEHATKVQEEKEEQRRIKEQMREEEAALREIERVQREAERDEQKFTDALERARRELGAASERQKATLDAKIAELEQKLVEAHTNKERALSRAQQTKSGYVYVISNWGSFGESVFKVGMTRRLDPMDRVRELGDASVPFSFDVHAMFFSENAPELENKLHKRLNSFRVNLVNDRKEFFRVQLDAIIDVVNESHGEIRFVREPEAEEYRKTLALRAEAQATGAPENSAAQTFAGRRAIDGVPRAIENAGQR